MGFIFLPLFILFLALFILQKKKAKQLQEENQENKTLEEAIKAKTAELEEVEHQINIQKQYCDSLYEKNLQSSKNYKVELELIKAELSRFQEKRKAVNEAIRREREIKEKTQFYSIYLSPDDIEDIEMLGTLAPRLRHRELIPKLIWDAIVSRPTNEMIKRVVGAKVGGIYKITYTPTGESYIGRTTNFKDRWKNHVQTALGTDKVARSTLHVHMAQHGLQNYTFEILEECGKEVQGEREKYYIDLYGTQTQMNMRAGG